MNVVLGRFKLLPTLGHSIVDVTEASRYIVHWKWEERYDSSGVGDELGDRQSNRLIDVFYEVVAQ